MKHWHHGMAAFVMGFLCLMGQRGLRAQDPGLEEPDYFPVPVIGSAREFSVTLKNGDETQKGTLRVKTEKEEEINGFKYFKQSLEVEGDLDWERQVSYSRYASDGVHTIDGDAKALPPYVNPPLPLAVGSGWTYVSSQGEFRCKAEAIEDVKVGDRTFKGCLKISETLEEADGSQSVMETWYAPKIGEVKVLHKDGAGVIEFLLVKPLPK